MIKEITSETIAIDNDKISSLERIEELLIDKFGDIIRWAIVGINEDSTMVIVSYTKNKV